MKKIFITIIAMLLPLLASAEDVNINGINYSLFSSTNTALIRDGNYSGNVTIPSSVTYNGVTYIVREIGFQSFKDCYHMTSISLPNSVTTIGSYAFQYCAKLNSITLPSGVKTIGSQAFDGCTQLSKVIVLSETPPTMNSNSFSNYNITLKVPETALNSYQTTWPWNQFSNIQPIYKKKTINVAVAGTLPNLIPEDEKNLITDLTLTGELNGTDIRFIRNMSGIDFYWEDPYGTLSAALDYYTNGSLSVLDISNAKIVSGGVSYYAFDGSDSRPAKECYTKNNTISSYMFAKCRLTTSIKIPNTVTSIESSAFSNCSDLSSVMIPKSVTSIGYNAFDNCPDLVRIVSRNKIPPTCIINAFSSKGYCTVWVPKGCKEAYLKSEEWKDFKEIKEIDGDIDLNNNVNKADIDALVTYIMNGSPAIYGTIADLNDDDKVNAADVVKLVSILNIQDGLSTDWQANFNSSHVISSLACTLNNEGDKPIQLTRCELYYNQSLVSYSTSKVTLSPGESKKCSFDNLASYSAKTGFSVVWHYTYNGENYTYRCDLTD